MKLKLQKKIYEKKTVYGDASKFGKNSNRLEKMLFLINSIDKKPKRILDVGCGTGFLTNMLKTIFPKAKVYGIDISSKALGEAKKKYKNVNFKYADAENELPFSDNYFDLVISGEHIEHVLDVDNCLLEINRVMKKGSYLIITTPNLASWFNRILLLLGKQPYKTEASYLHTLPIFSIGNFTFPNNLSTAASGHIRVMTLDMLNKLLKFYGFKSKRELGRTTLTKPFLRQFDNLISTYPSLASGLVVEFEKVSKVNQI